MAKVSNIFETSKSLQRFLTFLVQTNSEGTDRTKLRELLKLQSCRCLKLLQVAR